MGITVNFTYAEMKLPKYQYTKSLKANKDIVHQYKTTLNENYNIIALNYVSEDQSVISFILVEKGKQKKTTKACLTRQHSKIKKEFFVSKYYPEVTIQVTQVKKDDIITLFMDDKEKALFQVAEDQTIIPITEQVLEIYKKTRITFKE